MLLLFMTLGIKSTTKVDTFNVQQNYSVVLFGSVASSGTHFAYQHAFHSVSLTKSAQSMRQDCVSVQPAHREKARSSIVELLELKLVTELITSCRLIQLQRRRKVLSLNSSSRLFIAVRANPLLSSLARYI